MNVGKGVHRFGSVFLRMLASYILVLFLPISLFQFVFYPRIERTILDYEIRGEVQQNEMVQERISARFQSVYNCSNSFLKNANILSYMLREDTPANRQIIINEMQAVSISADYEQVYYYNPESDRLYTNSYSYQTDWLNGSPKDRLYVKEYPGQALFDRIRQADTLTLLHAPETFLFGNPHDSTLLIVPLNGYPGSLLFVIDSDTLLQSRASEDTVRMIVDREGAVLTCSSRISGLHPDRIDLPAYGAEPEQRNGAVITFDSVRYAAAVSSMPIYGIRTISLTPLDSLLSRLHSIRRWFLILLAALSAVGVVLVMILSKRQARPVHHALDQITALLPALNEQHNTGWHRNEWETIHQGLSSMEEYVKIGERYQTLVEHSKQLFLFRYIYDGIQDEQSILEAETLYQLDIRDRVLCAAFAFEDAGRQDDLFRQLMNGLEEIQQKDPSSASFYPITGFGFISFFLLFFFDDQREMDAYMQFLYNLPAGLKGGIGTRQRITEPGKSRSIAAAALSAALMNAELNIAEKKDINTRQYNLTRTLYDQLQNLDLAARRGNVKALGDEYERIVSCIFDSNLQYNEAAIIYQNIYNTMAGCLNRLCRQNGNMAEEVDFLYSSLIVPGSTDEMKASLDALYQKLLVLSRESEAGQDDQAEGCGQRINSVLRYIDEHHTDPDLTLASLADCFGVPYSSFSHWIRTHTGITFTGYLDKQRIAHAKELLRTTGMPLEQIANSVGYTNISTFNRVFKKLENMSPGSYRRENSHSP